MPPSGSLNRCRLYVPARTIWGALTAEVARRTASAFPSYEKVGEAIQRDVRLTYLYPGEQTNGDWRAWLPRYEPARGLVWQREGDQDGRSVPDSLMRARLLVTRPGTAVDPSSDSAAEGSLRETECIGQYWRASSGDTRPVGLVGYLLLREGAPIADAVVGIEELFVGGDTRYGLGRVRRVALSTATVVFDAPVDIADTGPLLTAKRVLGHADAGTAVRMQGDLELLGGWEQGRGPAWMGSIRWAPGSEANEPARWSVEASGFWAAVFAQNQQRRP
jgi:hypothetical protein